MIGAALPSGGSARLSAARIPLLAFALSAAALLAGYFVWRPNGPMVANNVDDVAESAAAGLAALAALAAARRGSGRGRRVGWLALAVGELAWCSGQIVTTVVEWSGGDVAFPGLPDVGFLLLPVGCLVFLARSSGWRRLQTGRGLLDAALILCALVISAWPTVLGQALRGAQDSVAGAAVAAAYPGSDVLLAAGALILLGRAPVRERGTLALVTAGLSLLAVSDVFWVYLSTVDDFAPWQWADTFWIAGFLLLAVAAATAGAPVDEPGGRAVRGGARELPSAWQLALPYLPVALAMIVLSGWTLRGHPLTPVTVIGSLVVVSLVLLRQLVVLVQVRQLSRQLEDQAFHDPLTGLANRALFLDRLQHALTVLDREHRPVAVLFVDLDGFKTINDSLGHGVGDRILAEVGARLRVQVDPAHTVARLGGDEFAVLVEGALADPQEVADQVQAALRPPVPLDGRSLRLRASVGVAALGPADEPLDATEILRRADVALYAAKAGGRDLVRTWHPGLAAAAPADLPQLAADLADALDAGRLQVHYQPLVCPRSGAPVAVEALARWTHPVHGPVSPEIFIPLAEQTGLIRTLTRTVLRTALADAARWRAHRQLRDLRVGVNVPPAGLAEPEPVAQLLAAVSRAGLPPEALVVEITENGPLGDMDEAVAIATALREAGFGLAIDDFGVGATSMAYLHQLPASSVKIDRSLIAEPGALAAEGLVDTIVAVTHALGRIVVAEGVETREQAEALVALGCDLLQGHLYSRALPAEELTDVLLRGWPASLHTARWEPRGTLTR